MDVVTEQSHEQTIFLLSLLGIGIPVDSTLAYEVLEGRLSAAIDAVQRIGNLVPESGLSLHRLRGWPIDRDIIQYLWNVDPVTGNGESATEGTRSEDVRQPDTDSERPGEPALYEVWDVLRTLAAKWEENGNSSMLCLDEKERPTLAMRVLDVFLRGGIPVIAVLYLSMPPEDPNRGSPLHHWIKRHGESISHEADLDTIWFLWSMLERNSKRIAKGYKAVRQLFESDFKLSFLLPVGRLTQAERARLTHNDGCEICGRDTDQVCEECSSAKYCSEDCKELDIDTHQSVCKRWRDTRWGIWTKFRLVRDPVLDMVLQSDLLGSEESSEALSALLAEDIPPRAASESDADIPNIHGIKPFILEVQSSENHMVVYDRLFSFAGFLAMKGWEVEWAHLKNSVDDSPTPGSSVAYRWAKITGKREISVMIWHNPKDDLAFTEEFIRTSSEL